MKENEPAKRNWPDVLFGYVRASVNDVAKSFDSNISTNKRQFGNAINSLQFREGTRHLLLRSLFALLVLVTRR
jgi:hypothetical protein